MTDPIVLQSTGNVIGPATSTDNSMVLFSGSSGKVIKGNNAVVTTAGLALLDDNNTTEQRNTLGLGSIATQNSNAVSITGGVITGITDLAIADGGTGASTAAAARANLSLLANTESDVRYAYKAGGNVLFDVAAGVVASNAVNKGQLDALQSTVNTHLNNYNTLAGIGNVPQARTNLGIAFGQSAGTYTQGNDSRVVNAVQGSRQVVAGNGLVGGGELANDITINMGTPSPINVNSTNSVSLDSHSHLLDLSSFFGNRSMGVSGYYILPGGLCFQWGERVRTDIIGDTDFPITFVIPFTQVYQAFGIDKGPTTSAASTNSVTNTGFKLRLWEKHGILDSGSIAWWAIGYVA